MEIKGKEGCIKGKRGEVRVFESYQSDAMSKKAKKTLFKYILLVRAGKHVRHIDNFFDILYNLTFADKLS